MSRMPTKRFDIVMRTTQELARSPMKCAWRNCTQSHPQGQQPEGWRSLLTLPGLGRVKGASLIIETSKLDVDGSLCPVHVRELRRLLEVGAFDGLDELASPMGSA